MLTYYFLLLFPLIFQFLFQIGDIKIRIGKKRINCHTIALPIFLLGYMLVLVLRYKYLGRDLVNYEYIFNSWGNTTLEIVFSNQKEFLFHLYNWFFYNHISSNYQMYISFTSLISVIPIMMVYLKDKSNGYLQATIFINMSTFIMYFSGIRQSLAISFGLLAYLAIKNKKFLSFFIWTILAIFTHHTGFMVLFLLPLYYIRLKKRDLYWIIPLYFLVFIFRYQIFNYLSYLMETIDDSYGVEATSTGAYSSFIMFLLFTIFSLIVEDERKMDDESYALRNILILATALQMFASVNTLAMRINYYFIILIPIAVSKSISLSKNKFKKLANICGIVMSIFFTVYFFLGVYISYQTGSSTLDTIPYIPFWENLYN